MRDVWSNVGRMYRSFWLHKIGVARVSYRLFQEHDANTSMCVQELCSCFAYG